VTGQVWAYARVSTRDQNPQLQLDALEASGYDTLVQEKESGKRGVLRPAWQALLPLPQPGDTLKFWKSDRWGRSAADVLATVTELRERGVTVVSLTENFDLATKEGRLMPSAAARGDGAAAPPPDPVLESVIPQSLPVSQTVGDTAN
jgi:DNA invertase Pin-like site-specific DNA recombinase